MPRPAHCLLRCYMACLGTCVLVTTRLHGQVVIYVNDDASPGGDGSSWSAAFRDLHDAIAVAQDDLSVDELWVAAGLYPAKSVAFELVNAVGIYGGFAGDEVSRAQRNLQLNRCILDGEHEVTVVHSEGNDLTAALDGFLITNGKSSFIDFDVQTSGGGIFFADGSSATVANCAFVSNDASYSGGAARVGPSSSPVFVNCLFRGNTAEWHGGAIANVASNVLTMRRCRFVGNRTVQGDGGGIHDAGSLRLVLDHCLFYQNDARGVGGGGLFSGYDNDGQPSQFISLTDCVFDSNTADTYGGGLRSNSDGEMIRCIVRNNDVQGFYGGGMWVSYCSFAFRECTFQYNRASDGAGVYNYAASITMQGCSFIGNRAINTGGGYLQHTRFGKSPSSSILAWCAYVGNRARNGAGGAEISWGSAQFINCVFGRNVGVVGGALSETTSEPVSLINCTIAANFASARGAGISAGSDSAVTNCILWGNVTAGGSLPPVNGTPAIRYSCVQGGFSGEGNITLNPLFADLRRGDFSLSHGSPCIDAGDNRILPGWFLRDWSGDTRRIDDPNTPDTGIGPPPVVDIGADEFD